MLLDARGITMAFGGLVALDGVDLQVEEGEVVALIGPNGAGKTTLFNVITGLYRPSRGRVLFRGTDITLVPSHRIVELGIARTFQNIRLIPNLTVLENILIGGACRVPEGLVGALLRDKRTRADRRRWIEKAEALLAEVGLLDKLDELARNLPYGLQRRLEIARALATEPHLVLLDEPTAGMNRAEKEEVMQLIRHINQSVGKAVLVIEHDMKVVMGVAHRVVVLDFGRRIADGPPERVRNDPAVMRAYLGEPQHSVSR